MRFLRLHRLSHRGAESLKFLELADDLTHAALRSLLLVGRLLEQLFVLAPSGNRLNALIRNGHRVIEIRLLYQRQDIFW